MSEKERAATYPRHSPPPEYTHTSATPGQNGAATDSSSSASASLPPCVPHPQQSSVMASLPPLPPAPPSVGTSLQDTEYWTVASNVPGKLTSAAALQSSVAPPPKDKSLLEAYILWLPLGLLGAHHFYLGRPLFGVLYFLSLGLFGVGWLIDLFRLPCLVSGVNRANRARYEQLQQLQQQLQQQRLQHEQQYGSALAATLPQDNVTFHPFQPRSLLDAYILWFPCGLFGYHHFYLGNFGMGVLYHFSFGLLGIGWIIDLFRMPSLVREANACRLGRSGLVIKSYSQCTAHAYALSPAGVLGAHHFYLDRPLWGFLYLFTLGLLGVGWVFDWFRVNVLVKRANGEQKGERSPYRKYLDDAYILCFPLGFTGLHHFYLKRPCWGVLYFFTLGIFGIGWLIDWFRLPCLVSDFNTNLGRSQRLISAGSGSGCGGLVVTASGNFRRDQVPPTGPSGYPPAEAGYGYYHSTYPGATHPPTAYQGTYVGPGYQAQGLSPPSYESSVDTAPPATKN